MPIARTRALLISAAVVATFVLAAPVSLAEDVAPEITAQPAQVDAGETFDLEVSVFAHANASYRVEFEPQEWFSFPGPAFQQVMLVPEDTHIFRVQCTVDEDTPSDDYRLIYNLSWTANGTTRQLPGTLQVTVGGGPGGDDICTSSIIMACAAATGGLAIAWRRRVPNGRS
jgi:hypothetical protein